MLVFAIKPGHDGAIAVVRDRVLQYSLESEKDSFGRYSVLTPNTLLEIAERVDGMPDVIALGGWKQQGTMRHRPIGAGYHGIEPGRQRSMRFFGRDVTFFTSSHERSHLMMALGMAPRGEHPLQTVLVWEGVTGAFYLVDERCEVVRKVPVLGQPGSRFSMLFGLADPGFPDDGVPRLTDAGKLMALAAYADPDDADPEITATVDRLMTMDSVYPDRRRAPKAELRDSPVYNSGVESAATKTAAALLTQRIFHRFAEVARQELPAGTPLRISGGCGLNCDWNAAWASFDHFSEVFVPPCTNDSGSAIGTAIDAIASQTGDPYIDWDVYGGLDFVIDTEPSGWSRRALDLQALSRALGAGRVVAWVHGRWEIGPRALGNRSLLAEPFSAGTKDRLNAIKQREGYRPIAPVCRVEDLDVAFHGSFEDPYMLYFRKVRSANLQAVTHVDGSARVQTVSATTNAKLHELLTAFGAEHGVGVLCNTSLNFSGHGFINRLSDLTKYCEDRGVGDMVVGDTWYERTPA